MSLRSKTIVMAGLIAAITAPSAASANSGDDAKWIVQAGVTRLSLRDEVTLNLGGAPVPGAALKTSPHYTPSIQIGRFVTRQLAVTATLGLPPHIDVNGAGSIAGAGKLGEATYGPSAFTLRFYPRRSGTVQPYVGAGLSYMVVFSTKDGSMQNLKLSDIVGPAVEGGANIMLAPQYGIFLDVKKALLRPSTSGTFAGLPATGRARIDPWVFSAGATFKF